MNNIIRTYDMDKLRQIADELGQPAFRAKQLYEWLHTHHATSYEEMTNLPLSLRSTLSERYPLFAPRIVDRQISTDGTRKYVVALEDDTRVEALGIPGTGESSRLSVCLSTQAGCSMGCLFCATGKEGFVRNLTSTEMLDQIIVVGNDFCQRVTNVVVMGQGEPFSNYPEVVDALRAMNDPAEFNIGARHITMSTCGLIRGIRKFAREPEQFTLAVSLHSALQQKRDKLMPRMANQPLPALKKALAQYIECTGRRVTLEYLLLKNVNDGPEDLDALVEFCTGLLCHVNLLPFNKIAASSFRPSPSRIAEQWQGALQKHRIEATSRKPRGADISGACGQLKNALGTTVQSPCGDL